MKLFVTIALILSSCMLTAQERPFEKEIREFKKADSVEQPQSNAIVFVGSSSFRMWKNVQDAFPGHHIINRGFGGSSLPHVIAYAEDIVIPYKPKQVVIYCGENDFMNDTVTSDIVVNRFITLYKKLRDALPRTEILYVSIKPSPSRQHLMSKMAAANTAIRKFLKSQRRTAFVDIWHNMLHMNEKGYAIWQKALEPHLK
jgi:lysophospholipase L1-like esterase